MEVYTKITNKEIEDALSGDLNRLWEVFSSLDGDKEFNNELIKIKNGVKIKFDIRSITENLYQLEVAFNRVRIERKKLIIEFLITIKTAEYFP